MELAQDTARRGEGKESCRPMARRTRWMVQERSMLVRPCSFVCDCLPRMLGTFGNSHEQPKKRRQKHAKTESCESLTVLVSGSGSVAVASCTGAFAAGGGA